jgi:phosphoenolpyruvate synthase/pyruvate phosphate dikinase
VRTNISRRIQEVLRVEHDWETYSRGAIPLHRLEIPLEGAKAAYKRFFDGHFKSVLYINIGPTIWWQWDRKDAALVSEYVLEQIKTEQGRKEQLDTMQEVFEKGMKTSKDVFAQDLTKLSDQELAKLYRGHNERCHDTACYLNFIIDMVDLNITETFKEMLAKEIKDEKDFHDCLAKIAAHTQRSFVNEEEVALLEIVKRIKEEGLDIESDIVQKDIDNLVDRFWWTPLGWENIIPNTKESFVDKLKSLLDVVDDPAKAIEEIDNKILVAVEQKRKTVEEHSFSEEMKVMIDMLEKWIVWHDKRQEVQMYMLYASHEMLLECCRRHGHSIDDLEWMSIDENAVVMETGVLDKEEAERRKQAVAVLVEEGNKQLWSGEEAKAVKKEHVKERTVEGNEFKGDPASPGKLKGIARVCRGAEEAASKMQDGDILVCGMTAPEYVPVMKKAAAIVTDQGGITCHAAVISRELGVPCIVGTFVATKKIKDGDVIEVDADKGVVRIVDKD